jgi:hypothetical protein
MTESVAVRNAIRLAPPPGGVGGRVAPADRYEKAYGRHLCPTCERDYGLVSNSGGGRLFGVITVIWTRSPDAALPPPSAPPPVTYGTRSICDGIPPVVLTGEVVQIVGTSGHLLEHDLRGQQHRTEGTHVLYGEEPIVDIPLAVQVGATWRSIAYERSRGSGIRFPAQS